MFVLASYFMLFTEACKSIKLVVYERVPSALMTRVLGVSNPLVPGKLATVLRRVCGEAMKFWKKVTWYSKPFREGAPGLQYTDDAGLCEASQHVFFYVVLH